MDSSSKPNAFGKAVVSELVAFANGSCDFFGEASELFIDLSGVVDSEAALESSSKTVSTSIGVFVETVLLAVFVVVASSSALLNPKYSGTSFTSACESELSFLFGTSVGGTDSVGSSLGGMLALSDRTRLEPSVPPSSISSLVLLVGCSSSFVSLVRISLASRSTLFPWLCFLSREVPLVSSLSISATSGSKSIAWAWLRSDKAPSLSPRCS